MPAHVLVVDDDAQQRADLAEIVKSLGYQVTTAADGNEALARLAIEPASAILTDLVMPGMDGVALLKELAARGDRTPAVVLTGFGSVDQAISCRQGGLAPARDTVMAAALADSVSAASR